MKSRHAWVAAAAWIVTASLSSGAWSQAASQPGMQMSKPPAGGEMTDGEIRKVDQDTKKLTIKHGPIKNLDMPGMTMLFQVRDPSMLDSVKPGDKVRFHAEKAGGAIVITAIEAAQ